jgi:hypothetical protein
LTSVSPWYLVAAIEHRDGSASCAAMVDGPTMTYQRYIHTDPPNMAWRREQTAKRVGEFQAWTDG